MHGDDITRNDMGLPTFPPKAPLWHRIMCVLGYHKAEVRIAPKRPRSYDGAILGPSRMVDQCGRCGTYLGSWYSREEAIALVRQANPDHEWLPK